LLDTTRAYAAAKLAQCERTDDIARRHAISYAKFIQHDPIIQSVLREDDLSKYAPHIGNVRAALEWALLNQGDIAVGIELATCAAPLFVRLSLLEECKGWCERALVALDGASRGTRQEMILQETLALSSMFTRGNGASVRLAIDRGLMVAETLDDRTHQLQLLAGSNIFLTRIGDFRGALAVAERARAVAKAPDDPAGLIMTEWMLGVTHHLVGDQAAAQRHCEEGMTRAAELGTFDVDFFGYHHRVRALVALARALWLRGFSDQAVRIAQSAIDEAMARDHPISVCISLIYSSSVFLWTGEWTKTEDVINRLIAYAGQYSLEPYRAVGFALKGELAITRNEAEVGVKLIRSALELLHTEHHNILLTVFTGALAEGLRKTGQLEEALLTINGSIGRAAKGGATFDMPELLRRKAEVLAAIPEQRGAAMECLTEAIAIAQDQSALALELRSVMTMARLLSESGHHEEARRTLRPVYDRFSEGFDTEDLRIARQLLEGAA
jgi:predicted ATPase